MARSWVNPCGVIHRLYVNEPAPRIIFIRPCHLYRRFPFCTCDEIIDPNRYEIINVFDTCNTMWPKNRKWTKSKQLDFPIHRWLVNCPHKGPETRKMFPFDDVIMATVGVGQLGFNMLATSNHVGGTFDIFKCRHQGYMNNPIFSNLGLCAACWVHFKCHHE